MAKTKKPSTLGVEGKGASYEKAGIMRPFPFQMTVEANQYLKRVCGKTRILASCEVRNGNPAQKIIRFSNESDVRLVAMSTHGHSGI